MNYIFQLNHNLKFYITSFLTKVCCFFITTTVSVRIHIQIFYEHSGLFLNFLNLKGENFIKFVLNVH
ncbi:hypothetical protein M153_1791000242 [Pseudoloma neurophilia]|uniref:Uncharacterized protein n=1 Tax=Pseudoloma neurophilia TaxID=146866 RepID=A0A0R0LUD9_9MICR|nr:hypothetical protein M153_1791000242 [Pseudoloma neurophilia]